MNTYLFCNISVIQMDNWMIGLIVALIISAVGFAMYHYNKQLKSGRRRADFYNFNPDRYDKKRR